MIELPYRFDPRDYQKPVMKALIRDGVKRAVCVWHRRAGKDKTFLNILVIKAMQTMGNYAYYFPTATLGRKALWDNIDARSGLRVIDHLPRELVAKVNEQQMKITLVNGSTIQVLGTETLDVVGGNPIGVIFSEAAQHRPDAFDYIRPILAENDGWALFNGTPRGKNWFFKLAEMARQNPDWFYQLLTVEDTDALSAEDIETERRGGMRKEMIQQEFFCDWSAALPGAIYGKVIEQARRDGRICSMEVDPSALVHTCWDLGSPRHTVVWYFQILGREIRMIDCDMGREETITERAARMFNRGFTYGRHLLPHDANQTERTGLTLRDELARAGLPSASLTVVPRTQSVWIGINHALEMFNAISFRSPQCDNGVEALSAYRQHIESDGGLTKAAPIADWAAHPSDVFSIMCEAHRSGLITFKHTNAEADYYVARPDWLMRPKRRGFKNPIRVSHTF